MAHYFVVAGDQEFEKFKRDYCSALTDKKVLGLLIARSLEIKKSYIEKDEYDKNERQVFNYGHSFGHAIESLTNYGIPHGIAISFGMDMSNFVSIFILLFNALNCSNFLSISSLLLFKFTYLIKASLVKA